MPASDLAALAAYGWSERVHALWSEWKEQRNEPRDEPWNALQDEPGRVLRIERGACEVVDASGRVRPVGVRPVGVLPPGVRPVGRGAPVAVGDWVALAGGRIVHVLPRWSVLERTDPAQSGSQAGVQVLAANVDVVLTAPADRLHLARVEREVVLAWESGARPLVVLTKSDLDDGRGLRTLRSRLVGVDVLATSARRGNGLRGLGKVLGPGVTGALLGPSGAGKSTLVNALVGSEVLRTATTRTGDARGRHTTTSRRLLCLPPGGVLIDMPGLRSLSLAGGPASTGGPAGFGANARTGSDVGIAFADIEALARGCRFRDCGHGTEPGCAVRDALATGALDAARFASFEKLGRELAAERRRSNPLEARRARRDWYLRAKEARRHDKRRPW